MDEPKRLLRIPVPNEIKLEDERVIKLGGGELDLTGWGGVLQAQYENWPADMKNELSDLTIKAIAMMFPGKPRYNWIDPPIKTDIPETDHKK